MADKQVPGSTKRGRNLGGTSPANNSKKLKGKHLCVWCGNATVEDAVECQWCGKREHKDCVKISDEEHKVLDT